MFKRNYLLLNQTKMNAKIETRCTSELKRDAKIIAKKQGTTLSKKIREYLTTYIGWNKHLLP